MYITIFGTSYNLKDIDERINFQNEIASGWNRLNDKNKLVVLEQIDQDENLEVIDYVIDQMSCYVNDSVEDIEEIKINIKCITNIRQFIDDLINL